MPRSELIDFIIESRSSFEDINAEQRVVLLYELNRMSYEDLTEEADFCEELLMK